jgi:hypothetical protein
MGFGDIEYGLQIEGDIRVKMKFVLIALASIGQKLKETVILFLSHFVLGLSPERLDEVDRLSIDGDGKIDKIGVFLNDLLNLSFFNKLLMFLLNMQDDLSSPHEGIFLDFLNLKSSRPIRRPFICWLPLFPRDDLHQIGDDERGIETNTKLPDNTLLDVTTACITEILDELFGPRFSNCSQIIN